jgi:fatty acid amide hydrolase 2
LLFIKDAREIDQLIQADKLTEMQRNSSLLGIPFTCKELIGVKGLNFSTGLVARKGLKAQEDAQVIQLMREAGAIIVCVTITSELGLWFESSNHVYGQSRNPFDSRRIVILFILICKIK